MSYTIRPAKITDAPFVPELIYSAYKDYAQQLCGSKDLPTILKRLELLFTQPQISVVHYSHYSVLIEDKTERIIGLVSCLRGDFIPFYFLNLAQILAQIADPQDQRLSMSIRDFVHTRIAYNKEYHLDVLAVHKDFRGQHLADLLLEEAIQRSKMTDLQYLSLLATDDLKDFYVKKGFVFHRQIQDFITYNIMYKPIPLAPSTEIESSILR